MTFDDFVRAELPLLTRYARLLTGDRQGAHDLVADAFVKTARHWNRIATMSHPGGYVRRVVTTTFLSDRRRWARRHIGLTRTGELTDSAAGGTEGVDGVDNRLLLHDLLSVLPRQQRSALVLRYYLDQTDEQIAAELGCSEGTARSYISRALTRLRLDHPTPTEYLEKGSR